MASGFNAYVQKNSIIHRLNPSLKLIGVVFLLVMVFLPTGFFGQLILIIIVAAIWIMSRLPKRLFWSVCKMVMLLFVIIMLINWITFKGPGVIFDVQAQFTLMGWDWNWVNSNGWTWGFNEYDYIYANGLNASGDVSLLYTYLPVWGGNVGPVQLVAAGESISNSITINGITTQYTSNEYLGWVTANGIEYKAYLMYNTTWYALSSYILVVCLNITFKISIMIFIITILTATTSSIQLTFAIEDILNPLRYLKIPVNEWAMTIAIAIRFVPSLLDESQKIMKAQASRGVDFNNGNLKDKAKSLVSLVVPMFSIAFKKADDLASAMEARNYNPRYIRTRYRNYTVRYMDWFCFAIIMMLFGFSIMLVVYSAIFTPFYLFDCFII